MAKVSTYVTGIKVHHMPDQHRAILQKAMKQSPGENPGTEEDGQPYHAELQDLRSWASEGLANGNTEARPTEQ